ncbi:MAG: hypothetical protein JST39_17140, partial [Bacteroidetes bacterium]|nr:hypothetical protein [Bacteroidota bacterium]
MKRNHLLAAMLLGMASVQALHAQEKSHMQLSNPKPETGKQLTIVYDPAGTFLQGKESVNLTIVYFCTGRSRGSEVKPDTVYAEGKKWKFTTRVPATANAFYIVPEADYYTDANNGSGYVYMVYKNGKPVERAIGSVGLIYAGLINKRHGIKPDSAKALSLLKQELRARPGLKKDFRDAYYGLLWVEGTPQGKAEVQKALDSLLLTGKESDWKTPMTIYYRTGRKAIGDSLVAVAREKFPRGDYAMTNYINNSYNEKDADKKVAIFNAIPEKFDAAAIAGNTIGMDYFRNSIAMAYAEK